MYNHGMDNRRGTHHRQSTRLPYYDYSQSGAYFVTLVAHNRACLFGEVCDGAVRLNALGQIVDQMWMEIPDHFPGVSAAEYVVMPNHVHGIIMISNQDVNAMHDLGGDDETIHRIYVGARHASPLRKPRGVQSRSLGAIIGSFKSAVTKKIHQMEACKNVRIWQRNYHERVIRDDREYEEIANYIVANPSNWELDREFSSGQ